MSGPFVPVLDIPFEAWAHATMAALNGAHSLWDSGQGEDAGVGDGSVPLNGYMDGYVPSTGQLITTKSTRANAFMAGAIARATANNDPLFVGQLSALVPLLIANNELTVPMNSNLITVLPSQLAYLRGATRIFQPLDSGPDPTSYTSAAVSAAVEGLTEQLASPTTM